MVSLGMIVVGADWRPREKFYTEIQWNGTSDWDPGAQRVHGLSKEHLEAEGVPEETAFLQICEFIATHFDISKPITLGGHNVSTFDRHFLLQLFNKYDAAIQLGGRAVDTYTLGKVLFGCENSNELFEMLGISRGDHNALEDAELALKAVRMSHQLFTKYVK